MKIITQSGEQFDIESSEIELSGNTKNIYISLPDGHRAVLGKYKELPRRVEIFSEIYAAYAAGKEIYKMPLK